MFTKEERQSIIRCFSAFVIIITALLPAFKVSAEKYKYGDIVNTSHKKYSYTEMQKDITLLQERYSDRLSVNVLGKTADGRDLYELVLGNPEADRCVLFQASMHAREYMCSQLVMKQVEYYLVNYDKTYNGESYREIFQNVCVHVVPMTNPDGVTISQRGIKGIRDRALRKKLKKMPGIKYAWNWKANARGVDLNNQFDYRFRRRKKLSKYARYAGYGGPYPVSENESKALIYVVNTYHPKAVVNYHAMGSAIFHNYAGDRTTKKKVARLTSKIRKITGYYYLSTSPGPGFANYLVKKKHIPATTVEIGRNSVPVPISQFKRVWRENKNVMAAVTKMYE